MIIISSFIFAFAVIILGSLRKTFFEDERQPDYVLGLFTWRHEDPSNNGRP